MFSMLRVSWLILQYCGFIIMSPAPIILRIDPDQQETSPTDCVLPIELGRTGTLTFLEDCESLDQYDSLPVPADFYNKIGTNSIVCCPQKKNPTDICFPSDPLCPTFEAPDYSDESNEKQEELNSPDNGGPPDPRSIPTISDERCPQPEHTCVPLNACSKFYDQVQDGQHIGHLNIGLPCGFDKSNSRLKVCCPDQFVDSEPQELRMEPRFPVRNRARKCMDRNRSLCRKWDKLGSCRTDTPFVLSEINPKRKGGVISSPDMFDFMVVTCQETCSLCGDAGCVDEHPNCVQWAREGGCFKNPEFMGHTCRESCGTCGFLSSDSREEQVVEGRGYSDFTRSNFHCGEFKQLCEVNGKNCDEVEDTTPTPSSTSPPVTQPPIDVNKQAGNLLFTYANANPEDLYCGFTFITDRFALEAAHCWDTYQQTSFGDIRFKQLRDQTNFTEIITVKKVYRHPEYNAPILYNDIAVVELSRKVVYDFDKFGDSPTCLDRGDLDLNGRNVTSIGYGLTEHGTNGALLAATMYVIPNDECKNIYNFNITSDRNTSQFEQLQQALPAGFDYGLICTQGFQNEEGIFSGPCEGDSGSPLTTTNDDDKDTLVGIVSGGIGCGLGLPAWYTKVEFYYDWVNCIVQKSQEFNSNKRKVEAACRKFATRLPKDKEGCGLGNQGELFNLRSDPCNLS